MLEERKLEILKLIIDEYTQTAEPVGSRKISRNYPTNLSSATIRNEMADLEELGYLLQPHTSAGRIPSHKAFRLYVDHLLHAKALDESEIIMIRNLFDQRINELEQVIRKTAHVISNITHYTSLILAPQIRRTKLRRIQLVSINTGLALVVIVTDAAVIKDAVIRIPAGITSDMLYEISEIMTERFAGSFVSDIDLFIMEGLKNEMNQYRKFFHDLSEILESSVVEPGGEDLIMDGAINMFDYPEYHDIDRAKAFLSMLNTREKLYRMLSKRTRMEFNITIGDENEDGDMKDCSLVTATYRVGGKPMGTVGVIGPVRMDYGKVLTVLDSIGAGLGQVISLYLSE